MSVVSAYSVSPSFEAVESSVRAFVKTAGVGVGDEGLVKEGVENPIDCVVQEAIADSGFVDISGFGVGDVESLIFAVLIRTGGEITVQFQDIVHQMKLEFLDIMLASLAFNKFLPGKEEILSTRDILKFMSASNPPPETSSHLSREAC